jgi:predicted esterase
MQFPTSHIHPPQGPHTHTVILLHGRGSNGPEFAEEFFSCTTSNSQTLASHLPTYRWVFPTSRERWSATFQEEMCSWFEACSVDDPQERQELQKDGLRESVLHILSCLETEAGLLNGQLNKIYLGGISQGMATALWTFLAGAGTGRIQTPLAGLLGFCGWLPFPQQLENLPETPDGSYILRIQKLVSEFFLGESSYNRPLQAKKPMDMCVLSTTLFLGHGTDDVWVSVDLGRQAFRILQKVMAHVEWNEFNGADNDGHWIKEPDGFDRVLQFLDNSLGVGSSSHHNSS